MRCEVSRQGRRTCTASPAPSFGSAVLEALEDLHIKVPVVRVGWPDKFIEHATTNKDLQDKYGMNAATAVAKTKEALTLIAEQPQKFRVLDARTA